MLVVEALDVAAKFGCAVPGLETEPRRDRTMRLVNGQISMENAWILMECNLRRSKHQPIIPLEKPFMKMIPYPRPLQAFLGLPK